MTMPLSAYVGDDLAVAFDSLAGHIAQLKKAREADEREARRP